MLNSRDRQILQIALPSIVSNITVPLLGLIDVAITGHLGSAAFIGAIAVGGMLFNITYWMFAFLRMGTSGMTAQARGRRDFDGMRCLLIRYLGIALAISAVLIIASPLIREVALWFIKPSPQVGQLTRTYFNICIWGSPASLGLFALNGWYIGMQNSRTPMFIAIAQNIMNILASLVLVYAVGMKVEGVALGTVIAQWGGFLTALVPLFTYYRRLFVGHAIHLREVFARHGDGSQVNRDIFLRTLCMIAIHFFFIAAGAKQGDTELAVNTLLMQLFTLYSYFMDGFAFAGEAMAGKAIGARNTTMYHDTVRHLFGWCSVIMVLFTLVYLIGGKPFLGILTDDAAVINAAMVYHSWTLLIPICGMAAFVWDGIYIGATSTRQMLYSTACGMLVFFTIYLALFPTLQNHALWLAFLANLSARGLVLTLARHSISEQLTMNSK